MALAGSIGAAAGVGTTINRLVTGGASVAAVALANAFVAAAAEASSCNIIATCSQRVLKESSVCSGVKKQLSPNGILWVAQWLRGTTARNRQHMIGNTLCQTQVLYNCSTVPGRTRGRPGMSQCHTRTCQTRSHTHRSPSTAEQCCWRGTRNLA